MDPLRLTLSDMHNDRAFCSDRERCSVATPCHVLLAMYRAADVATERAAATALDCADDDPMALEIARAIRSLGGR